MSTDSNSNWQTEEQIREIQFRAGYEQEAASGDLRPDERNDGNDSELKYTHVEGAASETTMYADYSADKYDPNEALSGRHNTRKDKYARLWELNCGWDGWRADGKNYSDDEIHKVDQPARERARFVHGVACAVELPRKLITRCTGLARRLEPRAFNYWGGMDVFILAIVKHTAHEYGWSLDTDTFHEIRERWDVSSENLNAAIEKVEERVD